jgi:putative DNA primase/helicase
MSNRVYSIASHALIDTDLATMSRAEFSAVFDELLAAANGHGHMQHPDWPDFRDARARYEELHSGRADVEGETVKPQPGDVPITDDGYETHDDEDAPSVVPDGPYDCTPLGNSERFIAQYHDQFIHVEGWGWMRYTNKWIVDEVAVIEAAKLVVKSIKTEAKAAWDKVAKAEGDVAMVAARDAIEATRDIRNQRKAERRAKQEEKTVREEHDRYLKALKNRASDLTIWAKLSQTDAQIHGMLRLASTHPAFARKSIDFDRKANYFNVLNGTIDLQSGYLQPHRAEDLITQLAPVRYIPDATSPDFDHVLATSFLDVDGHKREGLVEYAQMVSGYTLTGRVDLDLILMLEGKGGGGKTTFSGAVLAMMGDYGHAMRIETLTVQGNSGHNQDIAMLAGKRLVLTYEPRSGEKFNEGTMKQITGGERALSASRKGQKEFQFMPQLKLWVVANDLPFMQYGDTGIWRRNSKIPFDHIPTGSAKDEGLRDRMADKAANREAVLAWAVKGAVKWYAGGCKSIIPPGVVIEATEKLRDRMENLGEFFEDCFIFQATPEMGWVSSKDINDVYIAWADETSQPRDKRMSSKTIAGKLKARGCLVGDEGRRSDRVTHSGKTMTITFRGVRGVVLSPHGEEILEERLAELERRRRI